MGEYARDRGWPTRSCDLLLRAALCDTVVALEAWQQWLAEFILDRASWSEVRLLAAVGKRTDLNAGPRVTGIQKFVWAHTHMQLVPALEGLRKLDQLGIPLLLLKGSARVATNPSVASERLIRDVDVLVPLARAGEALEALIEAGWLFEGWQAKQRQIHPLESHHAWSVSKGRGEIDLHHFSNFLNRSTGDDLGLWNRSVPITWNGLELRVPSPEDALLVALIHGLRWSKEKAADWVLDAHAAIATGVAWDLVTAEAQARDVALIVYQGLLYLRDRIRCPVPDRVLAELLLSRNAAKDQQLYFYAHVPFVGI